MIFLPSIRSTLLLCCSLFTVQIAHGMEKVVFSNGFSVDCHHRTQMQDGSIRLFLNSDESSYLDVDSGRIRSFEPLEQGVTTTAPALDRILPGRTTVPALSIDTLITQPGALHRLDVNLLKSVVNAESGGQPNAVSHAGARGLMQLMPGTARSLGVADSFAPDQNLQGGTTYLDQLLVRYHDDLVLALAAYNAGPAAVDRYHGMPPYRETQAYVARIIREFNRRSLVEQRTATSMVRSSR